jgi:mono/diheme cytochrome c family protein
MLPGRDSTFPLPFDLRVALNQGFVSQDRNSKIRDPSFLEHLQIGVGESVASPVHHMQKSAIPMQSMNGFIAVAVLLFAFTAYAQSPGGSAAARAVKNPVPSKPASITAGAAAFKKYCAFCHNADAKGNGPLAPKDSNPPDLTDDTWVHGSSDGEIFTVIVNGAGPNSKMVGFKGKMPDEDVWHIVNYLRSLGPKTPGR